MTAAPPLVVSVSCLKDNYAYLVHDEATGATALIDAPEAAPIQAALERLGWRLSHILLTHHHADHVDGVAALRAAHNAEVIGPAAEARRLPRLDRAVKEGDEIQVGTRSFRVMETPGHTLGHIAYHLAAEKIVFVGDTLFSCGCGRLLEGTARAMWTSLVRIGSLPGETLIYFGHEYTPQNAAFALEIEPGNADLKAYVAGLLPRMKAGEASTPTHVGREWRVNPFLRAARPEMKAALGMAGEEDWKVFAEIRRRKDAA